MIPCGSVALWLRVGQEDLSRETYGLRRAENDSSVRIRSWSRMNRLNMRSIVFRWSNECTRCDGMHSRDGDAKEDGVGIGISTCDPANSKKTIAV